MTDSSDRPDQRTLELEVLAESSQLLTSTLDLNEVLDRLAGIARRRLRADVVRIWLLDDTGEFVELRAQQGTVRAPERARTSLPREASLAGWVITNKQPMVLADIQADSGVVNWAWFQSEGLISVLSVPIMLDDRPIGAIACLTRTRREFTPTDVALARALTAPAVAAVRNAAAYAEALGRLQQIEAFQRVASETLTSGDLEATLRVVLREVQRLVRSDAALCTYADRQSGRLRMLTGIGTRTAGVAGFEAQINMGASGLMLKERRPVRSDDYLSDPRFTRSPEIEEWARAEGVVAFICAPVIDAVGDVIAFLWAFNRTATPFTARDEAALVGLTQQVALAIDKARSLEDERRRAHQTEALLEIARACAATVELRPLLREVALRTGQAVGADACAISLWNGVHLEPVMAQFPDGRTDPEMFARFRSLGPRPLGEVPAHARAITSRAPVTLSRVVEWQQDAWLAAFDFASALVVPLLSQDQVLGAISLVSREQSRWSKEQVDLAMTIASQAALAVNTARHYQAAQQRASEFEALAGIAETLTSTLDLQNVLEAIADSAISLIGAQRAVVFELDQPAARLRARALRGIVLEPDFTLRVGQGVTGEAVAKMQPSWRADASADPLPRAEDVQDETGVPIGQMPSRYHYRGILAVPVVNRATPLGAVTIFWDDAHQPDPREIRLLSALARQAAIAMENARLVGDLRRTLDDLRAAQETLVRGATLRAVGELAAGAAHHLNNLMAVVLGRTQLLLMKKPDAAIAAGLRSIERAAADAAETVVRIQRFSRPTNQGDVATYELNVAVQEAIEFTRPRWHDESHRRGGPIELVFEAGDVPKLVGRSAEIREVMTNLILNAVDAMEHGGTICIQTRQEPGRVVVSVRDTGSGMAPEVKRRAFEPFFTTRGVKRTGLGLAVAYGIVRRHGGQVDLESQEGQGTAVTFWLPTAEASTPASPDGGGSILLIDDEADIRELVADILASRGHVVTVAAGGREGLARFETSRFDLVITDLGMPDLNGWEIARAIKSAHPQLPVLLLTGWADAAHAAEASTVDAVIKKPFGVDQLAGAVSSALEAARR